MSRYKLTWVVRVNGETLTLTKVIEARNEPAAIDAGEEEIRSAFSGLPLRFLERPVAKD